MLKAIAFSSFQFICQLRRCRKGRRDGVLLRKIHLEFLKMQIEGFFHWVIWRKASLRADRTRPCISTLEPRMTLDTAATNSLISNLDSMTQTQVEISLCFQDRSLTTGLYNTKPAPRACFYYLFCPKKKIEGTDWRTQREEDLASHPILKKRVIKNTHLPFTYSLFSYCE